jgi:hypothetical protein
VFCEQAIYDESGQLLTGSFMDYAMPRPGLVGGLKLVDHPVPTATNPLGAKGVGEAGVTGSLPALMNAVLDALRPSGVHRFDMPATPQRVCVRAEGGVSSVAAPASAEVPSVLQALCAEQVRGAECRPCACTALAGGSGAVPAIGWLRVANLAQNPWHLYLLHRHGMPPSFRRSETAWGVICGASCS